MLRHFLRPALLFLIPIFSITQLSAQALTAATAALEISKPSKALLVLNKLPKVKWTLVHEELAMQAYFAQEAYAQVLQKGRELAKTKELSSVAELMLLKSAIQLNRLKNVNEELDALHDSIDPDEYQLVMGMIAYQAEDFDAAAQNFEAAIAINPENAEAWTLRGQVLENSGYFKRAKQAHQFAVDLNPYNQNAHLGIARAYSQLKELTLAMSAYQKGIKLNPEGKSLLIEGSQLALDLAKYDLARSFCLRAIQVFPKDAVFYANLGMSYFYVQDYDNALLHLQKATLLRKDGVDHYFLGLAAIRSRRMDQAHQHLEMALSLGFEREDLPQLVEHCRSILASFDLEADDFNTRRF